VCVFFCLFWRGGYEYRDKQDGIKDLKNELKALRDEPAKVGDECA
jgi:hypothetical protein